MPHTITQVELGKKTGKIKAEAFGTVEFDGIEDYILFFENPDIFEADVACVRAGVPLALPVKTGNGKTTYWTVRAADLMKLFPAGTMTTSQSTMLITRVAGSPNDITVP